MRQRRPRKPRSPGRPSGGGGQAKILSAAELTRVDKCLAGTPNELRNRALVYLQYATGMRVGELASLDVGASPGRSRSSLASDAMNGRARSACPPTPSLICSVRFTGRPAS